MGTRMTFAERKRIYSLFGCQVPPVDLPKLRTEVSELSARFEREENFEGWVLCGELLRAIGKLQLLKEHPEALGYLKK